MYCYMCTNFNDRGCNRFYREWNSAVLLNTLWLMSVDILTANHPKSLETVNCKATFWLEYQIAFHQVCMGMWLLVMPPSGLSNLMIPVPDQDLELTGGGGGGANLIYLPCLLFSLLSFLRFLPKIRGAGATRAPPLDPPLDPLQKILRPSPLGTKWPVSKVKWS